MVWVGLVGTLGFGYADGTEGGCVCYEREILGWTSRVVRVGKGNSDDYSGVPLFGATHKPQRFDDRKYISPTAIGLL